MGAGRSTYRSGSPSCAGCTSSPRRAPSCAEAGAIVPQKRRLGLPGGRGSHVRGAMDPLAAPVAPSAPGAAEDEIAGAAAVTVPVATGALRPAVLEPAGGEPPPLTPDRRVR